jgi:hypothetical protein
MAPTYTSSSLRTVEGSARDEWGRGMLTIAEAAEVGPELAELRTTLIGLRIARLKTLLERGRLRGELREDLDLDNMTSLLVGPFLFRRLVLSAPATAAEVAQIIDTVLDGAKVGKRPRRVASNTS